MKKLEVFFDYNCPFCFKGHKQLVEFVKDKADLEIVWHPCEISVYKNKFTGSQGDINLQGMFFAADNNVDLWKYHEKVFNRNFVDKDNTKDIDEFADGLKDILDAEALKAALKADKYLDMVKKSNEFAFKTTGAHVVPTYRSDDGFLQDRQEFYNMGPSDTGYGGTK